MRVPVAFDWALDTDLKRSKLMRNVLFHLAGVKAKTPYDPEWLKGDDTISPATKK